MDIIMRLAAEIWTTFQAMAPYLLLGLAFAGLLHVVFSKELIVRHLGADSVGSVVKAALLGVPLPLCSCGVIPTALALRKSRASEGAVMSFLISTPQTGVESIVATWGMLGPVFAVYRPLAALVMGVVGGLAARLGRKETQAAVAPAAFECVLCSSTEVHRHGWPEKTVAAARYAFGTFLDDISVQLVIGIVISGLISFFIPEDFFARYVSNDFLGMLLMVAVGIPMYVCATASIPIAMALMMKGLSPGAAFVFLCAGPATNAAAIVLVTHAMGRRFTTVYLATMVLGSLVAGAALNGVFALLGNPDPHASMAHHHHAAGAAAWMAAPVYAFLVILLLSLARKAAPGLWGRLLRRPAHSGAPAAEGVLTVGVEGMTCSHCVAHVRGALQALDGARQVTVDLNLKRATVSGGVSAEAVREAIRRAGYRPV